jgi:repressor LexA
MSKLSTPLTPGRRRVLRAIERSIAKRGFPPTLQELCATLGLAAKNGVREHLVHLEREGWIVREPNRSRAIRVLRSSKEAV